MKDLRFSFLYVSVLYEYSWLQNRSEKIEKAERNAFGIIKIALKKLTRFSAPEKLEFQKCLSQFIGKIREIGQLSASIIHLVCRLDSSDGDHFRVLSRKVTPVLPVSGFFKTDSWKGNLTVSCASLIRIGYEKIMQIRPDLRSAATVDS